MFEINHVMLDQSIVDNVVYVQLEYPRHWHFLLDGKVHKVGHDFVDIGFYALSFYWNSVGVIWFDRFFLNIGSFWSPLIANSYFFECQEAIIKFVSDEDGRVKRYGHIQKFKGPVGE